MDDPGRALHNPAKSLFWKKLYSTLLNLSCFFTSKKLNAKIYSSGLVFTSFVVQLSCGWERRKGECLSEREREREREKGNVWVRESPFQPATKCESRWYTVVAVSCCVLYLNVCFYSDLERDTSPTQLTIANSAIELLLRWLQKSIEPAPAPTTIKSVHQVVGLAHARRGLLTR